MFGRDAWFRYGEFFAQMSAWLAEGRIKFREDIVDGLENFPQTLLMLFEGRNFGKLILKVADPVLEQHE